MRLICVLVTGVELCLKSAWNRALLFQRKANSKSKLKFYTFFVCYYTPYMTSSVYQKSFTACFRLLPSNMQCLSPHAMFLNRMSQFYGGIALKKCIKVEYHLFKALVPLSPTHTSHATIYQSFEKEHC